MPQFPGDVADAATASSTVADGVSAVLLLPVCLAAGTPLVGATSLALALLVEGPGAILVSWACSAVSPPAAVLPGTLVSLGGLVAVLRAGPVAQVTPTAPAGPAAGG